MEVARGLARNLAILLGSQVVTSLLGMVTVILLPIYLGDVGLGRLAFAQSVCTVLGTVTVLGTNLYIVREVAADRSRLAAMVWSNLLLRAPLWAVATAGVMAFFLVRGTGREALLVVAALSVVTLANVSNGVLSSALQGLEEMRRKSYAAIADSAAVLLAGLPLLVLTHSALAFCAALLLGALVDLAVNAQYFRRRGLRFRLPARPDYAALAFGAAPFLAMAVSQGVYSQVDTIALGLLSNEATVGWFAAAARLNTAVILVPVVMTSALFPVLSRLLPTRPEEGQAALSRMLDLTVLVVLPLAVGLAALAPRIFSFLGYPAEFRHSIPILVILCASWAVTALVMVLGAAVLSSRRQREWAVASLALVPVFVALNVVLIPLSERLQGNGGVGAALANLLGEATILAAALWILPRGSLGLGSLLYAARAVLAAAVMFAAVRWLGFLPVPLEVAAGGAVYLTASALLRTLTPADVRLAVLLLRRRGPGPGSSEETGQTPPGPGTREPALVAPADGQPVEV